MPNEYRISQTGLEVFTSNANPPARVAFTGIEVFTPVRIVEAQVGQFAVEVFRLDVPAIATRRRQQVVIPN